MIGIEFIKMALTFASAALLFSAAFTFVPNTTTRRLLRLVLLVAFAFSIGNVVSFVSLGYRPVPWGISLGLSLFILLTWLIMNPHLLILRRTKMAH